MMTFKNKIAYKTFRNPALKQNYLSLHKRLFLKQKVAHKTLLNWAFTVSCLLPDKFWSDVFSYLAWCLFLSLIYLFTPFCVLLLI